MQDKKKHPNEIQLTTTGRTSEVRDDIIQENSEISKQLSNEQPKRKYQPMALFVAVITCQLVTIFISVCLLVVPVEQKRYVYLTYIILTPIRCIVFLANSLVLIGCCKKLILLYLLLDNIFLVQVASIVTYIFLNAKLTIEFVPIAIACYPILLFFLVGNFRVMLVFSRLNKYQVLTLKIVKLLGATYFLVYGSYLIILTQDSTNNDLFMLWVFTTCGFWAQMNFSVNSFDSSDSMSTRYLLQDQN